MYYINMNQREMQKRAHWLWTILIILLKLKRKEKGIWHRLFLVLLYSTILFLSCSFLCIDFLCFESNTHIQTQRNENMKILEIMWLSIQSYSWMSNQSINVINMFVKVVFIMVKMRDEYTHTHAALTLQCMSSNICCLSTNNNWTSFLSEYGWSITRMLVCTLIYLSPSCSLAHFFFALHHTTVVFFPFFNSACVP